MEVRRHENEARRRAAPAFTGPAGERRPRIPVAEETAIAKASAIRPDTRSRTKALQVMGRARLTQEELVDTACALPWLDDRRRLDRDPQEPIAESVFERSFPQRPDLVR